VSQVACGCFFYQLPAGHLSDRISPLWFYNWTSGSVILHELPAFCDWAALHCWIVPVTFWFGLAMLIVLFLRPTPRSQHSGWLSWVGGGWVWLVDPLYPWLSSTRCFCSCCSGQVIMVWIYVIGLVSLSIFAVGLIVAFRLDIPAGPG